MDLFKIIEKLLSSNSPVILIFSLILIYLFHKFLIGPKIDAILQNTEKSKSVQDIDKLKEYIADKTENINEKIVHLLNETKDVSQKLIELALIIDHINENVVKKFEIASTFSNDIKQIIVVCDTLLKEIKELHEFSVDSNKDIKSITKNLAKTIFTLNDIVKKIEDMMLEIRAQNKDDHEYFELMKKKHEIEEQLKKKKESLASLTNRFSTNLYTYIDEDNLLTDEEIQTLLNKSNKE